MSATRDGERLAALRTRTGEAIAELRAIRCADEAAGPALDAIRLTAFTLECWWLPALDQLAA